MSISVRVIVLASAVLALMGCDHGGHDGPGDTCTGEFCTDHGPMGDGSAECNELRSCCDQLEQHFRGSLDDEIRRCRTVLAQASEESPRVSCAEAVDTLQSIPWRMGANGTEYLCAREEMPHDSQHGDCDEFLACAAEVAPATLPTLTETYGPEGACWKNTQEVADTCLSACTQNLASYRQTGQCGGNGAGGSKPDWLLYDAEVLALCEKWIVCREMAGGAIPEMAELNCRFNRQSMIANAPETCRDPMRAELACLAERTGCETNTPCGKLGKECMPNQPIPVPPSTR